MALLFVEAQPPARHVPRPVRPAVRDALLRGPEAAVLGAKRPSRSHKERRPHSIDRGRHWGRVTAPGGPGPCATRADRPAVWRAHLGFGRSVVSEIYGAHSVRRSARGAAAARVACNKRRLRCVWSVRDRSQEKIGAFHSSALNTVPKTPHAWRTRNSSDVAIRHLRSASASASGSASGPRPPRRPRPAPSWGSVALSLQK